MLQLVTFADAVGRVNGVTKVSAMARAGDVAAACGVAEPVAVDTLGTLVWSLPTNVPREEFVSRLKQAFDAPLLSRSMAELRVLYCAAVLTAREQYGESYDAATTRIMVGEESWDMGVAMSDVPLDRRASFKSVRIRVISRATAQDVVVRKLHLKPPGSRLDWGKSVSQVIRRMATKPNAIVMCRSLTSLERVFASVPAVSLPTLISSTPPDLHQLAAFAPDPF